MLDPQMLDMLFLGLIVTGSLTLFVLDKLPIDGVAFLVLLSLLLTGLVGPDRILDGFSNPATMTVAAMFILSAGLRRTGVVRVLAHQIYRFVGKSDKPGRLSGVVGVITGVLSGFVNNTAMVSVLLPVTLRLCRERNISPTRVLMMLSFAAQFGGVCTLIGTTTNLLVHAYAVSAGHPGFTLFEFAQLGAICFVVGIVYMLVAGHFLLPARVDAEEVMAGFSLKGYMTEMIVLEGSPLIEQKGGENALLELSPDIKIVQIIRDRESVWNVESTHIREGDLLIINGSIDRVLDAMTRLKLLDWAEEKLSAAHVNAEEVELVEVLVPRSSRLIGKTLHELDFYWRYHAAAIAVRRHGEVLKDKLSRIRYMEGDMLLLQGHKDDIRALQNNQEDFMFLQDLSNMRLKKKRAWFAVFWMIVFLATVGFNLLPVLAAAFLAAAGMVMSRCLSLQEAYESISLPVVILLAGLIPLGIAMQTTGAAEKFANLLVTHVGDHGPIAALAGVYAVTMVLTAIMSNTATAALLSPLAYGLAESLGVSATPFYVAVAFAASTCFTTPVGYQTNMMVYSSGGYKYTDFLKVGLPLNLIFYGYFCRINTVFLAILEHQLFVWYTNSATLQTHSIFKRGAF